MHRKFFLLLLVCFLISILGIAFHHHQDGLPHDNCSICSYVSNHSVLIPQDSPQASSLFLNALFISIDNTLNTSFLCYHPYLDRAPPE
jgi:hypothetical protein